MKRSAICICAAAVLLVSACLTVHAKVFWQRTAFGSVLDRLQQFGAKILYTAPMSVDGRSVRMTVMQLDRSAVEPARNITGLRVPGLFDAPRTVVTTHGEGAAAVRLVSVNLPASDSAVTFAVEPAGLSGSAGEPPPVDIFPGSRRIFSGRNELTGTQITVGTTHTAPIAVRKFYKDTLPALNWKPALVQRTFDETGHGMDVYLRDGALCCIVIDASSNQGENRVTVVYRRVGPR